MQILIAVLIAAVLALALALVFGARSLGRRIDEVRRVAEEHAARRVEIPPPPSLEPLREEIAAVRRELLARTEGLLSAIAELPRPEPPPPPVRVRVAEEVGPLLREASEVLQSRLAALEAMLGERRAEGTGETVARVLSERGFSQVVIVDGPVRDGDRTTVVVEARRGGMTFKGPVTLEGMELAEHGLKPASPMFP